MLVRHVLLVYIFLLSGIETPDRSGQWYQHLLTLFAIFYETNTDETNSLDHVYMFHVCIMCVFGIVFEVVQMLIISLEVTLCG